MTHNHILAEDAHKELLAAITDCLPHLDTYRGKRAIMAFSKWVWDPEVVGALSMYAMAASILAIAVAAVVKIMLHP